MINWFDMPAEGLSNGGQFEVKELEVTENGTYEEKGEMYNKVTVNVEGGGSSWQTVFEGSVTTEVDQQGGNFALLNGLSSLSADTIKVTFNSTEHTLNAYTPEGAPEGVNVYGDLNEGFLITSFNGQVILRTPNAGTYTLKIEEPQSGGSSDFSTAEVTISGTTGEEATLLLMPNIQDSDRRTGIEALEVRASSTQKTYNVPLFKGHCLIKVNSGDVDGLTGNVTLNRGWLDVTGNCSLIGYYIQN